MTTIEKAIKEHFFQLSKGQQKVAKLLLDAPHTFAIKSAEEIGKEVGVSETTVIRLCYALNFKGFSALQKVLREVLLQKSSLDNYHTAKLELANEPNFFASVMGRDALYIKKAINQINEQDFQKTVDILVQAEKVYICGLGSSFAAAQWFAFSLNLIREDVRLFHSHTDDILTTVQQLNDKTAFVAISFHRYLRETVQMAELAKDQKAFVCGITDSSVAPISRYTDALLTVSPTITSTLDAVPALFSLLNALIAGVSVQDKERVKKRKEQYEAIHLQHLFIQ
ncbi:MurR/RpiR family transcriptional regulator [Bacillus chungangensis]|uniref:DNA-binding MurR/RpiR family transcriptional regulator n=1 Tax=Bacillus chungangensis TaxID=587633 RepID=A0ABT9WX81_9BACI|nr:MurR/RpiR family transcriptional regulator [Bacillus chungangensis]MDQ0177360.1 DNA-binding MurR/RpiR family transcriptional regulator [Bacillus chungangensis]